MPPDLQPTEVPPKDPSDPRYRRYWRHYNRPYTGCGFLWTALLLLLIWWLASMLFPRTVH
jgi:hypothetical protein